jgi:hypothetical protein
VTEAPGAPGTASGWTPPAPPPPPKAPREARWLPTAVSFVVLLFVSFGGFLVAGEPSAATQEISGDESEPGEPIELVSGVIIHPPQGWSVERQEGQPPSLRLANGIAQMYIAASPVFGDPLQQLDAYLNEVLVPQASQISTSPAESIDLPSGHPAAYFAYLGSFEGVNAPLEGEVAAVVAPSGSALIIDGWAPEGQFVSVQQDVRATVVAAEVA